MMYIIQVAILTNHLSLFKVAHVWEYIRVVVHAQAGDFLHLS